MYYEFWHFRIKPWATFWDPCPVIPCAHLIPHPLCNLHLVAPCRPYFPHSICLPVLLSHLRCVPADIKFLTPSFSTAMSPDSQLRWGGESGEMMPAGFSSH